MEGRFFRILSFVTIVLGVLLRLYGIDNEFNYDEVFSVEASSGSFATMVEVTRSDRTHPPLYHALLYSWIKAFGQSEVAVRLLGVLSSSIFLLVLYKLVQWIGGWPGLLVLFICSVNPFLVYYGQWARPYCLAQLFAVLCLYLFFKCQEEPHRKLYKFCYGISCSALVYTQYLGVFILLPQYGILACSSSKESRASLLWGVLGMLSIVPWICFLGTNIQPAALEEKIRWFAVPGLFDAVRFYVNLLGPNADIPHSTRAVTALMLLLIVAALIRPITTDRKKILFIASLALLEPVVVYVISVYGPLSIWAPRQLIGSAIFFIYLVGLCIGALQWRSLRIGSGIALLGWFLFWLPGSIPFQTKEPWRLVRTYLQQSCPSCDLVVSYVPYRRPLAFYSGKVIHAPELYKADPAQSRSIAFICRPSNCNRLSDIGDRFTILHNKTIAWGQSLTDTKTIQIFILKTSNEQA